MKRSDKDVSPLILKDDRESGQYLDLVGEAVNAQTSAVRSLALMKALDFRESLAYQGVLADEILIEELHFAWWALKFGEQGRVYDRMVGDEVIPEKRPRN